ncbi:MAG: peptidylprolyl isomerase, FKBP-type [Nocardioides sp.]|nr:peptidylprolyl isomerase, FKBP-type [Nocardioides sp.]
MVAALTSCGSDDGKSADGDTATGLDAVTISGDPGTAPKVTWKSEMSADDIETTTLVKGDGAEVKDGDKVQTQIWVGNGYSQEKTYSTYDQGEPQTLTLDDQLGPLFADAMKGATLGSRVAVTASAEKAFGDTGNPQLGIGNKDTVLVILDLVELYQEPKPTDVRQSRLPGVVLDKGNPVALDFKGLPKPKADGDLLRSIVKEGNGKTVTSAMTVTANYLGQVYGAKKPFDESYSKKPVPFALTQVVQGWTYGLSGVKVGSRVLLQIPPDLGYGASTDNPDIPANSTLYFVVDIISAK